MNTRLTKLVSKLFKETADKLDAGTCVLTEDQALAIAQVLSHNPLSKAQACSYLNMSRATFDNLVKEGKLPKGRKTKGFKELVWYQDEISNL